MAHTFIAFSPPDSPLPPELRRPAGDHGFRCRHPAWKPDQSRPVGQLRARKELKAELLSYQRMTSSRLKARKQQLKPDFSVQFRNDQLMAENQQLRDRKQQLKDRKRQLKSELQRT